jgi:tetratricopeptide (TPR) repeat protein
MFHGASLQPVTTVQVPATVQAILAARIDRLPPEEKRLLETAAVVGKDFAFTLLQAIADEPDMMLRQKVDRLQAAEFLYETRLYPDLEYTFKHALTHEVAYGSLLHERRRALHARIVEAIEGLYLERLAEHVERLAHHAPRGEAWEKAVAFFHQAGKKAAERSAHWEATAAYEQALAALQHLPQDPEWRARAIDLHLDASRDLMILGEWAKTVDHARQAEAIAESLRDERRLGRAIMVLAVYAWLWGDPDRALELGQRALAIAIRLNDVYLQASANYQLGLSAQIRGDYRQGAGDYRQGAEVLKRVAEALQGDRRYEWLVAFNMLGSVASRTYLAWCLSELGEFAEAMAHGEEALRIAREVDHPSSLVFAYRFLGFASLRRGAIPQAIPPLERAVELCRAAEARLLFDITAAPLGYAYALSGRLPEGVNLMEKALADPEATGSAHHPLLLAYLGEAHLLAGRRDDAMATARRALDLAHRQKERGNEAWVLRLLGEIAAHADPLDRESAQEYYTRALGRADEPGMRPLAAHCHLGLGTLYRRTGDQAKAHEHLATATTMYREMGMGFWLEKVEAEVARS